MSKHYTAFQYDAAYKPSALRNWEVPKFFCHRSRQRTGRTQIIANAMGNLLPGVHRSEESPWGSYIGTWSMPRKINRAVAAKLNGSAEHKAKTLKCFLHYNYTIKPKPQSVTILPFHENEEDFKKVEDEVDLKKQEMAKKQQEAQESSESLAEKPVEEQIVDKPLCPIHDVITKPVDE